MYVLLLLSSSFCITGFEERSTDGLISQRQVQYVKANKIREIHESHIMIFMQRTELSWKVTLL